MGTGSFPGVKQPGSSVNHPSPTSTEVKEREELYLYSPSGPSWPVLGERYLLPLFYINFYAYIKLLTGFVHIYPLFNFSNESLLPVHIYASIVTVMKKKRRFL
jgi:hypothetical protein